MKNFITRYIKKVARFLKKKINFSFLNSAGVLLVTGVVLISLHANILVKDRVKNGDDLTLDQNVYHDLTYIKPFTSLVGFNWKFSKENKRKGKETKNTSFTLPLINF